MMYQLNIVNEKYDTNDIVTNYDSLNELKENYKNDLKNFTGIENESGDYFYVTELNEESYDIIRTLQIHEYL